MWRVILVDDEEFVRAELAMLFPWERYQFHLVGEAENSKEAIALIEAEQPELVITDIRMPGMDGLALIAWIRQNHPQIITAVVSAYNDFPYVREALRLGAVDFLMKAEATLETAGAFLERISGTLEHHQSARRKQQELSGHTVRYHRLAADSFWRDALTRASGESELKNRGRQLGIAVDNTLFGLIFIHVSNYRSWREEQEAYRMRLEETIGKIWTLPWSWTLIDFRQGDFIIVSNFVGDANPVDSANKVGETNSVGHSLTGAVPEPGSTEKLQKIARSLALDSTEKRTTSASVEVSSFRELPESFREVREMNLLRLYHQVGKYLSPADLLTLRPITPLKLSELLTVWERTLREFEPGPIHSFLDSLFKDILPHSLRPEAARRLVLDFASALRRISLEHQPQLEKTGFQEQNLPEILDQAESIDDWRCQLDNLTARYLQSAKANASPQGSVGIRKALDYLHTNFGKDLSLDEVANHAGVSKSYLSRVFPEYTGEHFSNYLQRLRIERAKELLRFTNDHIYEIASKVGFWNRRYFSKVFHEAVGMTPADYRRAPYEAPTKSEP